jgi:hypothetical protein
MSLSHNMTLTGNSQRAKQKEVVFVLEAYFVVILEEECFNDVKQQCLPSASGINLGNLGKCERGCKTSSLYKNSCCIARVHPFRPYNQNIEHVAPPGIIQKTTCLSSAFDLPDRFHAGVAPRRLRTLET